MEPIEQKHPGTAIVGKLTEGQDVGVRRTGSQPRRYRDTMIA